MEFIAWATFCYAAQLQYLHRDLRYTYYSHIFSQPTCHYYEIMRKNMPCKIMLDMELLGDEDVVRERIDKAVREVIAVLRIILSKYMVVGDEDFLVLQERRRNPIVAKSLEACGCSGVGGKNGRDAGQIHEVRRYPQLSKMHGECI